MVIWGQKLQQTNMLPGKRLRVTGGFGKAEVVCELLSAVAQKRPLNYSHSCSWEGQGGVVCYQFTSLHDTSQWWLSWPGLCPADRCELSGHILQCWVCIWTFRSAVSSLPQLWGACLGRGGCLLSINTWSESDPWLRKLQFIFQLPQLAAWAPLVTLKRR